MSTCSGGGYLIFLSNSNLHFQAVNDAYISPLWFHINFYNISLNEGKNKYTTISGECIYTHFNIHLISKFLNVLFTVRPHQMNLEYQYDFLMILEQTYTFGKNTMCVGFRICTFYTLPSPYSIQKSNCLFELDIGITEFDSQGWVMWSRLFRRNTFWPDWVYFGK